MTRIDYQWYWDLANKVSTLSNEFTNHLSTLDGALDVYNSAGTHSTAGHAWATAYDQSASDIFELTSLTAIAAGNLATMIHGVGKNHADAENLNAPSNPVAIPASPTSTDLAHAFIPRVSQQAGSTTSRRIGRLSRGGRPRSGQTRIPGRSLAPATRSLPWPCRSRTVCLSRRPHRPTRHPMSARSTVRLTDCSSRYKKYCPHAGT